MAVAVAIGVGATLVMDAWNLLLRRALDVPSLDFCLLGRWLSHMRSGTFRHASIATAASRRGECATGWAAHYTIGVGLALAFTGLAPGDWVARPTPLPALCYGLGTVVLPLFILQPALGLGLASSRTPRPGRARLKSVASHVVFGIGLYAAACGVGWALRMY